ncbi:MAG: DUF5667 domain-containing protein [Pseudonocardia sp.]|nr:DUF5667 domain-containing protein [Pseudonocardia sp.]
MPADKGNDDAERFAAALELGRPLVYADAELLRDLDIAAALRARGDAFSPHPDAKARARQRVMAALAAGARPRTPAPSAPDRTAPDHTAPDRTAPDRTASAARVLMPPLPPTAATRVDHSPVRETRAETDVDTVTTRLPTVLGTTAAAMEADTTAPSMTVARRRGRHTVPSRPPGHAGSRSVLRRGVLVGTAALVAVIALAGSGIFASREALPGDGLYALKRASESAGIATTFDEVARARRHLQLATTRLDEVEQLVARRSTVADTGVLRSTILEFDTSTGEGSRILLTRDDSAAIDDMQTWAAGQSARLSGLRPSLPDSAGADDSIELLARLMGRAEALEDRSNCTEVTSGAVDELGPLPAESSCAQRRTGSGDDTGIPAPNRPGAPGITDDTATPDPSADAEPGTGRSPASGPQSGAPGPQEEEEPGGLLPGSGSGSDLGGLLPDRSGEGSGAGARAGQPAGGGAAAAASGQAAAAAPRPDRDHSRLTRAAGTSGGPMRRQ